MAKPVRVNIIAEMSGDGIAKARAQLDQLEKQVAPATQGVEKHGLAHAKMGDLASGAGAKINNLAAEFTSRLGPAGGVAQGAVEKVTAKLGDIPVSSAAAIGGLAALGAGLVAAGKAGVDAFLELGEKTKAFQEASGLSAEVSSVLVDAFDDLGIGADTGASAMARLSKSAGTNKEALAELGVEVQLNRDGSVDMFATLGNVAEAMANTTDQAKLAAIGNAAFGRSWAVLMPLLEGGRKGIQDAVHEAERLGLVMSQDDVDAAFKMRMQMVDLHDSLDGMKLQIGRELIPVLTSLASATTTVSEKFNSLRNSSDVMKGIFDVLVSPIGFVAKAFDKGGMSAEDLRKKTEALNEAGKGLVTVTEEEAQSLDEATFQQALHKAEVEKATQIGKLYEQGQRDAAQAVEEHRQAQDRLTSAVMGSANASLNYEQQELRTVQALDEYRVKADEATQATNTYGATSDQARAANQALSQQSIDTKQQILQQAAAAVQVAQNNAEMAGSSLDAGQQAGVQRDFLQQLAQTLAPGSALRVWLDGYIDQLNNIPAAKTTYITTYHQDYGFAIPTGDALPLAYGGAVGRGGWRTVGERGPETVYLPAGSEVVPNHARGGLGEKNGSTVIVNVETGADPWRIADAVGWHLLTAGR